MNDLTESTTNTRQISDIANCETVAADIENVA